MDNRRRYIKKIESNTTIANAIMHAEFQPFLKDKLSKWWIQMGIYYGYPRCCIINFCVRGFRIKKEQKQVHKNFGFVPCPNCSRQILEGKATLESLLQNRICEHTFPNDDIE